MPKVTFDDDRLAVKPHAVRLHAHDVPVVGLCDEPRVCLSLNAEWASHVVGALEVLRQPDTWLGDVEAITHALQQIERLQSMLSVPCGNQASDLTQDAIWDTRLDSVFNDYDGSPDSLDRDTPETDFISDPDDTGSDEVDRIEALCWTCRLFIQAVCEAEAQRRQGVIGMANVITGVMGIPLLFLAPTGVPFLVISLVRIVLSAGANLFVSLSNEVLTNAASQEAVACCMYEYLVAQSVNTRAVFQEALEGCSFGGVSPEEALRGAISPMLQESGTYMGFLKQLGETLRYKRADLLSDCPCDDWSHEWLTAPNERPPFDTVQIGSYDDINEWYIDAKQPGLTRMTSLMNMAWGTPATITRIRAEFVTLVHNPFSARQSDILDFDGEESIETLVSINTTFSGTYVLDTGDIDRDMVGLQVNLTARHVANAADYIHFTKLTVFGRGFDPFS